MGKESPVLSALLLVGGFIIVCLILLHFTGGNAEGRIITVNDDDGSGDYYRIGNAIDAAKDGDTIRVFEGEYNEKIAIDKSLTLIGDGKENTTIKGNQYGNVVTIQADHVNMSGFRIIEAGDEYNDAGVVVYSDHVTLTDLISFSNEDGIQLNGSHFSTISRVTCSSNYEGIGLISSDHCTISNNTLLDNYYGISIFISFDCVVENNTIDTDFGNSGIDTPFSDGVVIRNNTVTGHTWGIDIRADDAIAINNSCGSNDIGIRLIYSNRGTVLGNSLFGNDIGIQVYSGSINSKIRKNNVTGNSIGIFFSSSTQNAKTRDNIIFGNSEFGMKAESGTVDAKHNFWGDPTGPYHSISNVGAKGDAISDHVIFDPWIGKYGYKEGYDIILYVDDNATEGGNGSLSRPYQTIGDAINAALEYSTIRVFNGEYSEYIVLDIPIKILGNGSAFTKINASSFENRNVVTIRADNCEISGLTITGGDLTSAYLINLPVGILISSDGNVISNTTVTENNYGLSLEEARNNSIHNNSFIFNHKSGILCHDVENTTFLGNSIQSNAREGFYIVDSHHNVIQGNDLLNNRIGIELQDSNGNDILSNSIALHTDYGMYVVSSLGNSVVGNIIEWNYRGIQFINSDENHIRSNNLTNNSEYGVFRKTGPGNNLDMTENWWGHITGPIHPDNPRGVGDEVIGSILIDPWTGRDEFPDLSISYVDDDAPEGGYGSLKHPFRRIQDALDQALDGDTIRILEGYYYGSIQVGRSLNIVGNGSGETILYGQGAEHLVEVLARGCTISGITLDGDWSEVGADITGIAVMSDDLHILSMTIENTRSGVKAYGGNSWYIIENSTIRSNQQGIVIHSRDSIEIRNNLIHDNVEGISLFSSSNCLILHNTIRGNRYGVHLNASNANTIAHNQISSNEIGIYSHKTSENEVYGNSIVGNTEAGIHSISQGWWASNIDARGNWWGDPAGPYHEIYNPGGAEQRFVGDILFVPFIKDSKKPVVTLETGSPYGFYEEDDSYPGFWSTIGNRESRSVYLRALAWTMNGTIVQYEFNSDIQGMLYTGVESEFLSWDLEPGRHVITVKALGSNGVWSDNATMTVTIPEPGDEFNGLLILLFMFLPVLVSLFLIYWLGPILYLYRYKGKGITWRLVDPKNIEKAPLYRLLGAGYRIRKRYVLSMFVIFVVTPILWDPMDYIRSYYLFTFSGLSSLLGIAALISRVDPDDKYPYYETPKMEVLKRRVYEGCICGNNSFLVGPRMLICGSCGMPAEEFVVPDLINCLTPDRPDPLFLFSRKKTQTSHTFEIGKPLQSVYDYLLKPPSKAAREILGVSSFKEIDDDIHERVIGGITYRHMITDRSEPFFISFEVHYLGELDIIKYYLNSKDQGGTTVLIERISDLPVSSLRARLRYRKEQQVMKWELGVSKVK